MGRSSRRTLALPRPQKRWKWSMAASARLTERGEAFLPVTGWAL